MKGEMTEMFSSSSVVLKGAIEGHESRMSSDENGYDDDLCRKWWIMTMNEACDP